MNQNFENENEEVKKCVVCGTTNNTVFDRKNGLHDIGDFQILCEWHSNQKKNTIHWTIQNNKRYSALNIPSVAIFNISFILGDDKFDINNENALVGTYWHDPVKFMKDASLMYMQELKM